MAQLASQVCKQHKREIPFNRYPQTKNQDLGEPLGKHFLSADCLLSLPRLWLPTRPAKFNSFYNYVEFTNQMRNFSCEQHNYQTKKVNLRAFSLRKKLMFFFSSLCGCKLILKDAQPGAFVRLTTIVAGLSLTHLSAFETLFLLLGCLVQPQSEGFCHVLLYLVLSCLAIISWRSSLFQRENGFGEEGR